MAEFKYYTRGGSSPQGKPRVYFTAHADDYGSRFEDIREDILKRQNCAVFYLEPDVEPSEVDDYELRLSQMQLFVVPVTTRLLTDPNRAMDFEVPFALAHHIPVLPLMQERGLDEPFKKRFGDLQYLDKHNTDPTAIPYDEKLTKYLNAVIVGDELAAKVRAAFDAYIFLSYRKKDRRCAQELMRLIHSNPLCRDIAIWYDEFLTPGEDFNDAIRAALEKCEIFAIAVTPNLINEINYILTIEYPAARELNKDILPAEMEPTDRERLSEMYDGIPEPVEACNSDALRERLLSLIQRLALTEIDSDPQHNFFIGLAYLSGIDVEVDHERAAELITGSAEAGCAEAVEKLISMYETGEGVQRDYRRSVTWRERLIDVRRREYEEYPDKDKAILLVDTISHCGDAYYELRMLTEAGEKFKEMLLCVEEIIPLYSEQLAEFCFSICYKKLGDVAMAKRDLRSAEEYYLNCLEISKDIARETYAGYVRRDMSLNYSRLGDVARANGDPRKAENYYRKGLEISEALAREAGTAEARRGLSISCIKLGDVAMTNGAPDRAEEYYRKSLKLFEALARETGTVEDRRGLSINYGRLGDTARAEGNPGKAEEYYLKGFEISEALARETGTIEARRDLAISYEKLGDIAMENGDPSRAEEYYSNCLEIREALSSETGTVEARRDLSISYDRLAEIATANGDPSRAEHYYRKSLEIREALARETGTVEARRNLSTCYTMLGDIARANGDMVTAEEYYRKAFDIREDLARETGTVETRRDLSISYIMLGDIARANGDPGKAEDYYRKGIIIFKALAGDTGTVEARRDLSATYERLGDAAMEIGSLRKAEEYYRRGLELSKDLAREIGTLDARRNLLISYSKLGDIAKENGDPKKAEEYYRKSFEIAEALAHETGTLKSCNDLALSYCKLGQATGDREYYLKAQKVWLELSEKFPDVSLLRQRYDYVTRELSQSSSKAEKPDTGNSGSKKRSFFDRFRKK